MAKRFPLISLVLLAALLILAGCATTSTAEKLKPETVPVVTDIDEYGGADVYGFGGDNAASRYYVNPDFYRMKSDENLVLIEGFKTYQQTSEWSCGACTALMVLWHFDVTDLSEWDIAVAMKASTDMDTPDAEPGSADNYYEYGVNVEKLAAFFENLDGFEVLETSYRPYTEDDLVAGDDEGYTPSDRGNLPATFSAMSLYTTDNDDMSENWVDDAADSYFVTWLTGHLKAGRPVMVEWADWDGHWQAIIGYDSNGTPGLGDDILIFADPYDTSDHWQDGYYYYPLERWFYMWHDRAVAPKPFQLQPFVVVDKK